MTSVSIRRLPSRLLKSHSLTGAFTFGAIMLLAAIFLSLSSCKAPSDLGLQYFKDTISTQTSVRNDTSFIKFTDTVRSQVNVLGSVYPLTDSSTMMIIGQVNMNGEQIQSWGVLQFLPLTSDTAGPLLEGAQLQLKAEPFSYGDTTNDSVVFSVYVTESGLPDNNGSSDTSLPLSSMTFVSSVMTHLADTTDSVLTIPLDLGNLGNGQTLTQLNYQFIIVPGPGMTNARGFGNFTNYGDQNSIPELQLILKSPPGSATPLDTVYHQPYVGFHVVQDNSMKNLLPGELMLRGSLADRIRVNLNLNRPTDTAQLNQYTTINDAELVFFVDTSRTRVSNQSSLLTGPDVVQLGSTDSGCHYDGVGFLDSTTVPGSYLYRFQVRGMVEEWLRDSVPNLGFELRSGFVSHTYVIGPATETIGVEDNTLNRWTFYGPAYSDPTKRPYFTLSWSKLK